MSNGPRSPIIICVRESRLVRENHHPRIEDDLFDEISNTLGQAIWRLTGKRIWQPVTTLNQMGLAVYISKGLETTYASGIITAQAEPSTRHSSGTNGVAHTIMPPIITTETITENQNLGSGCDIYVRTHGAKRPMKLPHRFIIFGTSLKKLERSTSFFVALHVIL